MKGCSTEVVVRKFRDRFGTSPEVVVSAPGRIDFLNTHQDYKGLPVIAVGIDLRTYVALAPSRSGETRVFSENMGSEDRFRVEALRDDSEVRVEGFGKYVRASFRALMDRGFCVDNVYAYIASDVPVASGLGSSAALMVALIGGLSTLFELNLDRKEIAETAFHGENRLLGIPCGRLDQYASAFGGVIKIETRPPYGVEELSFERGVYVVIDSGIRHSTAEIHPKRQAEINEALRLLLRMDLPDYLKQLLGESFWEPKWEELLDYEEELTAYLQRLPSEVYMKRILFTLRMHRSTLVALSILRGSRPSLEALSMLAEVAQRPLKEYLDYEDWDLRLLGLVMIYQHKLLSELYDVSLPFLDRLVEASIEAGAYGAKLSGAGLGGSVIALAGDRASAQRVLQRCLDLGAPRGWIVSIDRGITVHEVR